MEKNTKINFQQWKNIENFSSKLDKKFKFGKMEVLIGGGAHLYHVPILFTIGPCLCMGAYQPKNLRDSAPLKKQSAVFPPF